MQTRRRFIKAVSLSFGYLCAGLYNSSVAMASSNMDISDLIDLDDPASHCNQDHDHNAQPDIAWQAMVKWSTEDTGFNEGAYTAITVLIKAGVPVPDFLANLPQIGLYGAAGNLWRRRDMMEFAKTIYRSQYPKAAKAGVAIVVASQWHNCHAFRCLAANTDEIGNWLGTS